MGGAFGEGTRDDGSPANWTVLSTFRTRAGEGTRGGLGSGRGAGVGSGRGRGEGVVQVGGTLEGGGHGVGAARCGGGAIWGVGGVCLCVKPILEARLAPLGYRAAGHFVGDYPRLV